MFTAARGRLPLRTCVTTRTRSSAAGPSSLGRACAAGARPPRSGASSRICTSLVTRGQHWQRDTPEAACIGACCAAAEIGFILRRVSWRFCWSRPFDPHAVAHLFHGVAAGAADDGAHGCRPRRPKGRPRHKKDLRDGRPCRHVRGAFGSTAANRSNIHRLFRQTAPTGHPAFNGESPPMMNASMPGALPCRRLGCAASLRRPWRAVAWHTSRPAASISRAMDGGDVPDAPPPPDPTDDPNDWRYDPKPGSAAMSKVHPASEGPNPYQAGLDWAFYLLFTPHRPRNIGRCGVNSLSLAQSRPA